MAILQQEENQGKVAQGHFWQANNCSLAAWTSSGDLTACYPQKEEHRSAPGAMCKWNNRTFLHTLVIH